MKPFQTKYGKMLSFVTPNMNELNCMATSLGCEKYDNIDPIQLAIDTSKYLIEFVDNVIVTMGKHGILIVRRAEADCQFFCSINEKIKYLSSSGSIKVRFYPIKNNVLIKNVSGAGDCFAAGFIYAALSGVNEQKCISVALEAAKISLNSYETVPKLFFGRNHPCWSKNAFYEEIL